MVRHEAACPNCATVTVVTCNLAFHFTFDGPVDFTWYGEAVIDGLPDETIDEFTVSVADTTVDFIAARGGVPLHGPHYLIHNCPHRPGGTAGDRAVVLPEPPSSYDGQRLPPKSRQAGE